MILSSVCLSVGDSLYCATQSWYKIIKKCWNLRSVLLLRYIWHFTVDMVLVNFTTFACRLSRHCYRAFPVTAARIWNSLPQHVTSGPSMSVFESHLKAFLFRRSFPWLLPELLYSACAVTVGIFGLFNRSFLLFYLCPSLELVNW